MHALQSILLLLIIVCLIMESKQASIPRWYNSSQIISQNLDIITRLTLRNETFIYTFVFNTAFSSTPYLGYGIKTYEGGDYLAEEFFQVIKLAIDQHSFQVTVKILGFTSIFRLNVVYITIDKQFPHHVNTFDDVPVNYSSGPIVNISVISNLSKTYTNTINYTQQALNSKFYKFSEPLNSNKVILFLTSLHLLTNYEVYPIQIKTKTRVISQNLYQIEITFGYMAKISKMHYSIVIFDQYSIKLNTNNYSLVYKSFDLPSTGGFVPIPQQFSDNLIMGLMEFSTNSIKTILDFQWQFSIQNNIPGVLMPESIGRTKPTAQAWGFETVKTVGYSLFYFKGWVCPTNTFLDHSINLCTQCAIEGCILCFNFDMCQVCDTSQGYTWFYGRCLLCSSNLINQTMQCQQKIDQYIVQKHSCNRFKLSFIIDPIVYQLSPQIQILNPSITLIQTLLQPTRITIFAQYSQSIQNQQILLKVFRHDLTYNLQIDTMFPAFYYNQTQCKAYEDMNKFVDAVIYIAYTIMFFSLISFKIVGLELFGVLQLLYFSLLEYNYYNIYIQPIKKFKIFNGISIPLMSQKVTLPSNISELGISSNFLNNFNIIMLLSALWLLVSFILYMISKYCLFAKLKKVSKHMFKQGFITLLMFSAFNIAFSAGIHFRYVGNHNINQVLTTVLVVIVLAIIVVKLIVMELFQEEQKYYGEFKLKFKNTMSCKIYIAVSMVYRIAIGLYIGMQNQYLYCSLIVLTFNIGFVLYNLINLPFKEPIQNYRCNLMHLTQTAILLVANYYRCMKSNTPLEAKSFIYGPIILLIVLAVLCLVVSFGVLLYEIISCCNIVSRKKKKVAEAKDEVFKTYERLQFTQNTQQNSKY